MSTQEAIRALTEARDLARAGQPTEGTQAALLEILKRKFEVSK